MGYDSTQDTMKHIGRVRELISQVQGNLQERLMKHDESKLKEPEKSIFDEFTPKLKGCTYGSDEYKAFLESMKVGLNHHYSENRHHPEHRFMECNGCFSRISKGDEVCRVCGYSQFTERVGFKEMTLLDIIEMLCDWKAAGERHADGSITKSLKINKERFGISDEIHEILWNTVNELGWIER